MKEECPEDLVLPPELEAAKEREFLLCLDEVSILTVRCLVGTYGLCIFVPTDF